MSALMLDRNLLRLRPRADVRAVARTVTLTALRRLDGERKGLVVRALSSWERTSRRWISGRPSQGLSWWRRTFAGRTYEGQISRRRSARAYLPRT
jgi:hypothetical protein